MFYKVNVKYNILKNRNMFSYEKYLQNVVYILIKLCTVHFLLSNEWLSYLQVLTSNEQRKTVMSR